MDAGGTVDFNYTAAPGLLMKTVNVLGDYRLKKACLFQSGKRVMYAGRRFLVDGVDQGAS
jgi:hypothetical protein